VLERSKKKILKKLKIIKRKSVQGKKNAQRNAGVLEKEGERIK
jgi:hypothetical protein